MMIELIMVAGSRGGYTLLEGYEERLADLDVRPHWGQYNTLDAERIARPLPGVGRLDGRLARVQLVRRLRLSFTRRVGISSGR